MSGFAFSMEKPHKTDNKIFDLSINSFLKKITKALFGVDASEADKPTIMSELPVEMLINILGYVSDDPLKLAEHLMRENHTNGIYYLTTPGTIIGQTSHKVTLDDTHKWAFPVNLCPCKIVYDHMNMGERYLFSTHCFKSLCGSNSYEWTDYTAYDDLKENRFNAKIDFHTQDTFFDGSNDNDYFLIAGNIYSKKEKNNKDSREYQYTLGQFTDQGKKLYKKDPFNCGSQRALQYSSEPINGTLMAIALCKSDNRYALVDTINIRIFTVPSREHQLKKNNPKKKIQNFFEELQPLLLGACSLKKKVQFKKVSFISPSILFGITRSGILYRIDLNEEESAIKLYKQALKRSKREKIKLKNIAVDSCDTHHILLHTKNKEIIYWDLRNHKRSDQGKEFISLWRKKEADQVWFYNNKISFGIENGSQLCVENYTLDILDFRVKNSE
jgi:hypothetical protein